MYARLVSEKIAIDMDQSDIKYILDLINDAVTEKDWDIIEEAKETLKEFLDVREPTEEE